VTNCTTAEIRFPVCKRREVGVNFSGGSITSDGGVLLLREIDRRLGLTEAVTRCLPDPRKQDQVKHHHLSQLRQRVYALAHGYEDLNDHQTLRQDPAVQTAVGRDTALSSPSTLCRFENRMGRAEAVAIHKVIVDQFIASFTEAPAELVLDFDATDDPVHGQQEGRFFHGYYDHYCFLPLYVFCGEQLLVSYLRPSKIDGAKHAWAILALLVKRLRQAWPQVKIIFRGDSGFCRWRMLAWCDRHGVDYIVGLAKNSRLNSLAAEIQAKAERDYESSKTKQRLFQELNYAAATWDRPRRIIAKAEHSGRGANPRYVVTSLPGESQALYDDLYCARGEMENRIKEQQLGLFADRTSCHHWWPNQFRLLLSSLAYVLLERLRNLGLKGTELARSQVATIRLKLLKIGAAVIRNTRRVKLMLSSSYPYQEIFRKVAGRLLAAG